MRLRAIARNNVKMIYGPRPGRHAKNSALFPRGCLMNGRAFLRIVPCIIGMLALSIPAFAQVDLTGSWAPRLYEDYIERGPGSDLGDFTGVPMNDEARAKALLYTSNLPSMIERQCLAVSPWVGLYRPLGLRISSDVDAAGKVIAWKLGGDYLRD